MRKIIIIVLVIVLYIISNLCCMAQPRSKRLCRELTIYMRVKDHFTHDDIDSTMTTQLLMAADSSYVDSVQISRSNYQGQRFTYAQSKVKAAGNLQINLDALDLLGNLSNVRRTINAQGRTETFYNVLPSYAMLHVAWRFNKKAPKK